MEKDEEEYRKSEEEKKKIEKAEEEYRKSEERLFAPARLGKKPSINLNETVTKTNAERAKKKKNNKVDRLKLATGQMQDSIVREGLGRTLEDIRSKNDKLVSNSEVAALKKKRQAAKAARAAKV